MPSLDRAATEVGDGGFPESLIRPDNVPFGNSAPFGPLAAPEIGGVARLPRLDKVGENGPSGFWY